MKPEEKEEINEFLTEAMGECWHELEPSDYMACSAHTCHKCYHSFYSVPEARTTIKVANGTSLEWKAINNDFFTWEGFGKLKEWLQEQPFWGKFKVSLWDSLGYCLEADAEGLSSGGLPEGYIHPKRLASVTFLYLKTGETK